MGLVRKAALGTIVAPAAALGYLHVTTTVVSPLAPTDAIFSSEPYKRYNVNRNATTNDVCFKSVSLNRIRPELLKNDGDLALELCRGVWSGWGYSIQRRYLQRKWYGPETASQLWTPSELATSSYEPGTRVTDHFEVVDRTPTSVVIRCGDSPRKQGPRDSDGLFVISAKVDRDSGTAQLALTSCFFNSAKPIKGDAGPMPLWMEYLHRLYSRIWLVSASQRTLR